MKKKIFDYFNNCIAYPQDVSCDPIPYGILWTYISSTFLNGFINYVEPFGFYVLNRYSDLSDDISDREAHVQEEVNRRNWFIFNGTKGELIDKLISKEYSMYHTKLDSFGDDVVIISEIGEGKYMFFWFDMDSSDCSIGRFETTDSKEEIIQSIKEWINSEENLNGYTDMPIEILQGWLSF